MHATVFGTRLSPFVEKVVRGLQLKRIPYGLIPPARPGDFKRWNPQARKMPVVEIEGKRVFDSTLILRWLDELVREPAFFDPDPMVAARQRFLEDWSDESLYWYGLGLRWSDANAAATTAQVIGSLRAPAALRPLLRVMLRRQFRGPAIAQGLARLPLEILTGELARRFDELVVWLDERPYFFSEQPGAADLAIFSQLDMLLGGPTPQAAQLIAARPPLAEYVRRVDAATAPAPGVQQAAAPPVRLAAAS
jgi:glutathione S-transferase